MTRYKAAAVGALTAVLAVASIAPALANGNGHRYGHGHGGHYYGNPLYPIVGLAAAVVGTAAAIVTLPFQIIGAPPRRRRLLCAAARNIARKAMPHPVTRHRRPTTRRPRLPTMRRRRHRTITRRPRLTMRRARLAIGGYGGYRGYDGYAANAGYDRPYGAPNGGDATTVRWRQLRAAADTVWTPEWQLQPASRRLQQQHALGLSRRRLTCRRRPKAPNAAQSQARRTGPPRRAPVARGSRAAARSHPRCGQPTSSSSADTARPASRPSPGTPGFRSGPSITASRTRRRCSAPSSIGSSKDCDLRPACRSSPARTCDEILRRLAGLILHAALTPQALALHRLIVGESARFPKLAVAVTSEGATQEAIALIGGLLGHEVARGTSDARRPDAGRGTVPAAGVERSATARVGARQADDAGRARPLGGRCRRPVSQRLPRALTRLSFAARAATSCGGATPIRPRRYRAAKASWVRGPVAGSRVSRHREQRWYGC